MEQASRNWNRVKCIAGITLGIAVAGLAGCRAKSDVPVGDAAENIRKLTLAYVQYAASHRGIGPPSQEVLTKYLVDQKEFTREEIDRFFVSPRDNQPYVIRWGIRPVGTGVMGPDPPKPAILIFEQTGVESVRYVADGQMSVKELSAEEFAQAVPDDRPPAAAQSP